MGCNPGWYAAKNKKKRKKSYRIKVQKDDDENDHEGDIYLPIKITIHITHHNKRKEDASQDVTLTLLPCPIHETRSDLLDKNRYAPVLQSIWHRESHGGGWGWYFIILFE